MADKVVMVARLRGATALAAALVVRVATRRPLVVMVVSAAIQEILTEARAGMGARAETASAAEMAGTVEVVEVVAARLDPRAETAETVAWELRLERVGMAVIRPLHRQAHPAHLVVAETRTDNPAVKVVEAGSQPASMGRMALTAPRVHRDNHRPYPLLVSTGTGS
jgi:hypothetical protein